MNNYLIMPVALMITLILTWLISVFFKRPIHGLWMFAIIVFLSTWASQLWIPSFGPVSWGVAWVSILCTPVFFWVFILALTSPSSSPSSRETKETSAALNIFFWLLLLALLLTIGVGYYKIKNRTNRMVVMKISDIKRAASF
jgi:hypothetical protein